MKKDPYKFWLQCAAVGVIIGLLWNISSSLECIVEKLDRRPAPCVFVCPPKITPAPVEIMPLGIPAPVDYSKP